MKNPAKELAFLLENWRVVPNGQSLYAVREVQEDTINAWRLQMRAVQLLAEVDQSLEALSTLGEDVAHYQEYLIAWARSVFAPDIHWGTGSNSAVELFPSYIVSMLKATGDLIDRHSTQVVITSERRGDSIEALDEIVDFLARMDLPEGVRRYVFELVNSCRTVLQETATLDSVDLFARIHELAGVLLALVDSMTPSEQSTKVNEYLRGLVRRLVPYGPPARVFAGFLGAAANLKELGG